MRKVSKNHSTAKSFSFAVSGIEQAIKDEPNIRIQIIFAAVAIVGAFFLNFSHQEWIILFFTIAFVLILELINTTLEAIVDIVSPSVKPQAKAAKDVAAAAVLVSAVLAVVVGIILYLPKILPLLNK